MELSEEELKRIEDEGCGCAMYLPECVARDLVAEVRRLRKVLQVELDGCWCDDRDGNCNPPHKELCARCKRLAAAL